MSASQERQPTLDSVAPRFLVGDMEQALAFYGQLGFATPYHDEGALFGLLSRRHPGGRKDFGSAIPFAIS